MRFLIGSSYFDNGKRNQAAVSLHWWNTVRRADPQPTRYVVISEANSKFPWRAPDTDVVNLTGNLGYCGQLLSGEKPYEMGGWSATMCAMAMLAYADEADFLYSEQDCLAFGPWVRQMYADLGDGDLVFGRKHESPPWMACSQSLFLVRHRWIPSFVAAYLMSGSERDVNNIGENKFVRMEDRFGADKIKRLSFGVDRTRPIPWGDRVLYFQQPSSAELEEGKARGLLI